jgi:hypothetical protein
MWFEIKTQAFLGKACECQPLTTIFLIERKNP